MVAARKPRGSENALDTTLLLTTLAAIKKGDFSVRLPINWTGINGKIADTLNAVIELNAKIVRELERMSKVVGKEGKISQRASLGDADGRWVDMIESVNTLIGDLVWPTSEMSRVISAVAKGDLSQTVSLNVDGRPLEGEFLNSARIVNSMVTQLGSFASEVTRVAREVGTEGKLGGQAEIQGVAGLWKDLTESVNSMAANLTDQVRNIAEVTTAVANGELSKKITVNAKGEILELKNTVNTMVDQLSTFASEVTRVAREVGTDGRLGGQAEVRGVSGTWKDLTDSVNSMAANLTNQVRNIAAVTTSVATGDLSKKITVDVRGEVLQLKDTINTMVDQLSTFASEVTRVAGEVGTDGKLGGQAQVKGVSGTWKDLTDNVNSMAANLTNQVRGIAKVVTAVANGNLRQKLTVEAKGEIAELADTINGMIDTLATFADQVTTVAREVGVEGQLGGQANVPGAAGIWKDLTDNVNRLAANLTTQVRAIAEVSTAVTKGDLSRSIAVETAGEVAALKDNINEMIRNLRDTTRLNAEQDWLKTNVARFTRLLQGQRDMLTVAKSLLSELAPLVNIQHGIVFVTDTSFGEPTLKLLASYGYTERKHLSNRFRVGEGLVGQCFFEKQKILLTNVPGEYIKISSGLGDSPPLNIVVLPILFEGEVLAVMELASFSRFSEIHIAFLDQLVESVGIVLNTITATMRTEELLKQSQSLTAELQTQQEELTGTNKRLEEQAKSLQASEERLKQQQEELQQTNEELEEKARLLAGQNAEVERKNRDIELARIALEEKAEQLTLTSKYKSEFLANMSHELRTPLNSMLLLSKLITDNVDGNLTEKQVEYASTIHASGSDLLMLINDILDLSKIESGAMDVDMTEVLLTTLQADLERTFRPIAAGKGLAFTVDLSPHLPGAISTDEKRLQQILKNLLSNAFKFTEQGEVKLRIHVATSGWSRDHEVLNRAHTVVAFVVSDTGIGISEGKQKIIFEAFQQADGTTSRKYGGTGLGLSISREIAHLLGGEIRLVSSPEQGSIFTLCLPQPYSPITVRPREAESGSAAGGRSRPSTRGPSGGITGGGSPSAEGIRGSRGGRGVALSSPQSILLPPSSAIADDAALSLPRDISDDRETIQPNDGVLLVIEDDPHFARVLIDIAHEKGFKGLIALSGESGLALAQRFKPDAITLDIRLPEMGGWTVLDRLKHDANTRHIPVHIISAEEEQQRALESGALTYLTKPVTKEGLDRVFANIREFVDHPVRRLLVVENNVVERNSMAEFIGDVDVETTVVGTGAEALTALKAQRFDCMVLDLMLPDMPWFELTETLKKEVGLFGLPIIVYTAKELTVQEEAQLRKVAQTIIVKGIKSPERLLDETALFLHRVEGNLSESKRQVLQQLRQQEPLLIGKHILIVDDDIRNIFALTSVLERHQMRVSHAENGKDGLELLKKTPGIDIVLMDIMMPEMDGYETLRAIRQIDKCNALPVIALTAKAMKGDRERCIEAGASDYISKPVDTEQLLSLLRVWLYYR